MSRRLLATLSAALLLTATSCNRRPDAYLIGVAGPQTLEYGIRNQHGIDLAVEEINRAGGIHGVPLRVVKRDDRASGVEAATIADEFVANTQIVAVVGHVGSDAEVAAARVYDRGRLPAVATSATSPDITGISPWVFRMITSDSVNGAGLARFASSLADSLQRPPRVAILYSNDAYGRGLKDAFVRGFRGEVLSVDPIGSDTDVEPYIAYYKIVKPDLVFVASIGDPGIRILHEASRQHLHTTFLGGDGWEDLVADSLAEGAYVGTPFTAQRADSMTQRFVAAYRAKFGTEPFAQAAMAYDAVRLVARAMEIAGPNRDAIRNYLASLSDTNAFTSLSGPLWFTSANDPVANHFHVARVHDGVLLPVAEK